MSIIVEPTSSKDHCPCQCCGNISRTVWGFLHENQATIAAYYVQWTLGRLDHDPNFDFIIGQWGEQSTPNDRSVVAAACRFFPTGPQFMIIDAASRPISKRGSLAARSLQRDQVIGTPLAKTIFTLIDSLWLGDTRIAELTGSNP